jgi:4-diphosphocytidyl-2-C-methyl-D-erythritol kinase
VRATATASAPSIIGVAQQVGVPDADGHREVASLVLTCDLEEIVAARHGDPGECVVEISDASSITVSPDDAAPGEDDLALRAARLLRKYTGHPGGVRLSIARHAPTAAGMGAGAADAAATLVACDALWGLGLSRGELQRLATRLGAPVALALAGGAGIIMGQDEEFSPLLHVEPSDWVLVPASYPAPVPDVYASLDAQRELEEKTGREAVTHVGVDSDLVAALRDGRIVDIAARVSNDLEAAASVLRPEVGEVMAAARRAGAVAQVVSGTGPTVAMAAEDREAAERLATVVADELDVRTVVVRAPARGAHLLR